MRQQMTFSLWLDCAEFMNLHMMELNRSTHMHMYEHKPNRTALKTLVESVTAVYLCCDIPTVRQDAMTGEVGLYCF